MKQQQELFKVFTFTCREFDITEEKDVLQSVCNTLLEKMVHTHGNELVQNRRMLANIQSRKTVDAPTMLRETQSDGHPSKTPELTVVACNSYCPVVLCCVVFI